MINLFNTQITNLSLHKIGNKFREEPIFLSDKPYKLSDEIAPLLKEFFLKPFREKEENFYQFAHDVDLEYNEMYNLVSEIFANPDKSHDVSKKITEHLYNQSLHPHIKSGEVYVTYLQNVSIDNVVVDCVGIFKSEIKSDFIELDENGNHLEMILNQGISLEKLDKGVLIFNYKKEEGYKILTHDSNRYDARYFLEHFLQVDAFEDEAYFTKKYLKFCQGFAKDIVLPAEDKKEEVLFLNKAVNHFAKNDNFEETAFLNEVIENPDLIAEFKNYKVDTGAKYSIEDVSSFGISNTAVKEVRRKFKNLIQLDTGITIKMDFTNSESADKFVERGYDEDKQMYYYLCYYNKENK